MLWLELVLALLTILIAAEIFVNALEHLGEKLHISEGVTGSVFAAVGTALPETMVPLLAIFAGTSNAAVNQEIGVGAILGAPLMLSTLSLSLLSFATLRKRGVSGAYQAEPSGLKRDMNFFLIAFGLACIAMYIPHTSRDIRYVFSFVMVSIYIAYVFFTLHASAALVEQGHGTAAAKTMFLSKIGVPTNLYTIPIQLLLGLGLLVAGSEGFIHGIQQAAPILGISALILSLLVVPIATELPEKINSILWIRGGKDTLAFGNITGALVFQGTLLPAIGIGLTPWTPQPAVLSGVVVTLIAIIWLRLLLARGALRLWHLWVNGSLYLAYLGFTLLR